MARGREFRWNSAQGETLLLTDEPNGFRVLEGVMGLGKPKYTMQTQDRADNDGAVLLDVRGSERTIFLPTEISGPTRATFLDRKQRLSRLMDPVRGEGWLEITDANRHVRIRAIYAGGLEGNEGESAAGEEGTEQWSVEGISLACLDPYFETFDPYSVQLSGAAGSAMSFFPIFPLKLNKSQLITTSDLVVNNVGTKEAWPVWKITGPGSALSLWSKTLDLKLAFSFPIPAGVTVTIDTKNKIITTSDGSNMYGSLIEDDFWPFVAGANVINLAMPGTDQNSRISGSFLPRMESLV